ncbi:MAG: 7-cyano-7-deazaguanine synthase [Alphaproteobacteria bacterium]|jgi:7-cyano-7-deazaguanine synthase
MLRDDAALVLFSGGQDSAACLLWALETFASVETIGFDYGQRHNVELEVRQDFLRHVVTFKPEYRAKLKDDTVYTTDLFQQIGDTSLTSETEITIMDNGLPSTFVPARNLMFFTIAGAHGWRRNIRHFIGGMCETDFSGYPDCRDTTLKSLQVALAGGLDMNCIIHTPLMWLDKAQTWRFIHNIAGQAGVDLCIEHTHSCYKGMRDIRHEWGYGCDNCPACNLRKKGYFLSLNNNK